MPEPTVIDALDVTSDQRQALAECVAIVAANPHLTKHTTDYLLSLWAAVALDETLEG